MRGGTLGHFLHDPLLCNRVFVERIGAWEVWASDRRNPGYVLNFQAQNTPIQLLRETKGPGMVSVLTPCAATQGRFQLSIGSSILESHCCQRCVRSRLRIFDIKDLPEPEDWICYLMLESRSFIDAGIAERGNDSHK